MTASVVGAALGRSWPYSGVPRDIADRDVGGGRHLGDEGDVLERDARQAGRLHVGADGRVIAVAVRRMQELRRIVGEQALEDLVDLAGAPVVLETVPSVREQEAAGLEHAPRFAEAVGLSGRNMNPKAQRRMSNDSSPNGEPGRRRPAT